jgi:hypothetical protein
MKSTIATILTLAFAWTQTSSATDWRDIPIGNRGALLLPTTTFIEADTGRGGVNEPAIIRLSGKNIQNAALSHFRLSFLESDHKIRMLGALQVNSRAELYLNDRDGNDRFVARAGWHTAEQFVPNEVSSMGGGELLLRLTQPTPSDSVIVLRGFKFERKRRTDANIRLLGVQVIDEQTIRVSLVDDQGADFRNFERALGRSFAMSFAPFGGGLFADINTSYEAVQRLNGSEFGRSGLRNYAVTVQYVTVPKSMVADLTGAVSGTSRLISAGSAPAPNAKVVLRGFRFFFGNSDHHLKTIAVNLPSDPSKPAVTFEDGNADDPFAWSVDYMTLK